MLDFFQKNTMLVNGQHFRTIWEHSQSASIVQIIDQRLLPHKFEIVSLHNTHDCLVAIKDMYVRGAPLIGATAAYGMYLACMEHRHSSSFFQDIALSAKKLIDTRPTAINLKWAVERVLSEISKAHSPNEAIDMALNCARNIANDDAEQNKRIGFFGKEIIQAIAKKNPNKPVNILTHCNAGWLATVDYGTATAPIYEAVKCGIPVHVWVDETRPRNQGARLTAWELSHQNVPHTVIPDNTGGHLMQHGLVDIVIVGSDRTTFTGDVANKIGTYLKALAANDNNVPFYVALPSSTIDWSISDGINQIEIEERSPDEVRYVEGLHNDEIVEVLVPPATSPVANYGFDVTPSRLVTGLITERGVCLANEQSILALFPERKKHN